MEFSKFEAKPYIKAMKFEIEISYPTEITYIIKAGKATARAQSSSSSGQVERQSITLEPTLRPSVAPSTEVVLEPNPAPPSETTPSNMALGK